MKVNIKTDGVKVTPLVKEPLDWIGSKLLPTGESPKGKAAREESSWRVKPRRFGDED